MCYLCVALLFLQTKFYIIAMNTLKTITLSLLLGAAMMPVAAQETVDLASQRKESQRYGMVPGQKLDHKGIIINPTPHALDMAPSGSLYVGDGISYPSGKKGGIYSDDLRHLRITESGNGARLQIAVGDKEAAKHGVEAKSGAYKLVVDKKGIHITAFDDAGAFYGLQTLRQLIDSSEASDRKIPYLTINDYPDLPYRGVVEGFYGTPWSHDVRLSLIEFYGRNKMNNYIYGPKDDPYHSSPNWRQPYPEQEARQISELVEACKRNRVNFVWAIHPGQDIRWNKEDYDSLVHKLDMMYDLGIRSFAIFFDDISGIGTDSNKQSELINDLTRDFVKTKGDVTNLMICPTDYTEAWANPGENGQLAVYGRKLNPDVEVFWTGSAVCSDLTPSTLEFVNSRIKRPALYWWNFPVSDYCRNYILQGPSYGLDTSLTSADVAGIESNPMEHGEASKLALYGVADYTWNVGAYNPIDNWERGLADIAPEDPEAYRTFAIHSADTETGYRRAESWETETFPYNSYTPEQFEALARQFAEIQTVPARMEKISNKQLLNELNPWLIEFGNLGKRGSATLELIKTFENGNDSAFWNGFVANLMTPEQREAFNAHKSGTMKLQPFYENAMDNMLSAFYTRVAGHAPSTYRPVGTYRNLPTTLSKLMLDNNPSTYYTSAYGQRHGDWIGLDLGEIRPVEEVEILQGRNSVDDVDYFDNTILEASMDGKNWTALTDSLLNTYEIRWAANEPVDARYVRIRKLHSPKRHWASVRVFSVNPPTPERIGIAIEATDPQAALSAFDNDPTTSYKSTQSLTFDRSDKVNSSVLLLSDLGNDVTLKQFDAGGKLLESRPITSNFTRVTFNPDAAKVALNGTCTVYEIIAH